MLGSQAAPRRRNRTEQLLVGLIVALTLWGIVMQVMVRSYVRQERSLTDGDEERLAEQHGQSATFPSHRLHVAAQAAQDAQLRAVAAPRISAARPQW